MAAEAGPARSIGSAVSPAAGIRAMGRGGTKTKGAEPLETHPESFRDERGAVRAGWRAAMGSFVGLVFSPSVLQVMSLGVFAPHLRAAFGWTLGQISVAAMLLAVMTMIVSPLQGVLVDRFGARRLILASLPAFSLGYAALALTGSDRTLFYAAWSALPVLGIGLWPASYVKATSSWFDQRLGLAIAVATVGIGVGAALFPLAIEALIRLYDWRIAFAAIGFAALAIAWPVTWRTVRDCAEAAPRPAIGLAEAPRAAGRRATFPLLFAAFLLLGVFSTSILFHLVSILQDNGMSRGTAVVAQSMLGGAMVVGRLGSGLVVDRVPVRRFMPAMAVAAAAAIAVLLAGANGLPAAVAAVVAGLLVGAEIDILGFAIKRYFGMRHFGALYGILFSVFQGGGALGVYTLGAARDASGSYHSGLLVLLVASLGAAVLFALLGPYRFERPAVSGQRAGAARA